MGAILTWGRGKCLIDEAADFAARGDLKGRLVKEIALALVRVQPGMAGLREFESGNDDRALATRALLVGDAVATKIHYGVVESLNTDYARTDGDCAGGVCRGASLSAGGFPFPFMLGSTFAQEMRRTVRRRLPWFTGGLRSRVRRSRVRSCNNGSLRLRRRRWLGRNHGERGRAVCGQRSRRIRILPACKRRLPEAEAFEASTGGLATGMSVLPARESLAIRCSGAQFGERKGRGRVFPSGADGLAAPLRHPLPPTLRAKGWVTGGQ